MSNLLSARAATLFDELSWPSPENENWRRTDLGRLLPKQTLDKAAELTTADIEAADRHTPLLPENYAARIITEAGRPVAIAVSEEAGKAGLVLSWSERDDLPAELDRLGREELSADADRVGAWHWRDLPGVLDIRLPAGSRIENPVVVEERLMASAEDQRVFTAPHLHVAAGENAEVDVVWSFEGAPAVDAAATPIVNAGLTGLAAANSRVHVTLRQNLGDHVVLFMNNRLETARDGRFQFIESHLGAALVKTQTRGVLAGEGADLRLKGLYVAGDGKHVDIGTLQEHRSPRATSDALYKGAVKTGGRSIFQGLIEVAPKASKTDAYLTNKNLVLGDGARADSIPQLNILTDDVKCSHGSTTGKLDEAQLFYLQSRGYSRDEAVREITRGFLAEVIDGAPQAVAEILSFDLDLALGED